MDERSVRKADRKQLHILLMRILHQSRIRRERRNKLILLFLAIERNRRKRVAALLIKMLITPKNMPVGRPRRLQRNEGWFETMERVLRKTFQANTTSVERNI